MSSRPGGRDKDDTRLGLVFGAPGIGKTRMLLELKTLLPDDKKYAFVTFNNATILHPRGETGLNQSRATFGQMVCTRLLFGACDPPMPFSQWQNGFDYSEKFRIEHCLSILGWKPQEMFCLAIDEITSTGISATDACEALASLTSIWKVVVYMSGHEKRDWEEHLDKSRLRYSWIGLTPLTDKQVANILDDLLNSEDHDYSEAFNNWRLEVELRSMLQQIGGVVPQLLEHCVEYCKEYPRQWDNIRRQLETDVSNGSGSLLDAALETIIHHVVCETRVQRAHRVAGGLTYDELQARGCIQLIPPCRGSQEEVIYVPFIQLCQWVASLSSGPRGYYYMHILSCLMDKTQLLDNYLDFERHIADYFAFLIRLRARWSDQMLTFEELLRGATWPPHSVLQTRRVAFKPGIKPRVHTAKEQFPKCGPVFRTGPAYKKGRFDDGDVFINGNGARFLDVWTAISLGENTGEQQNLVLGFQYKLKVKKHEQGTAQLAKSYANEYQKKWDNAAKSNQAFEDYALLIVLLSTAPMCNETAEAEDEDEDEDKDKDEDAMDADVDTDGAPPYYAVLDREGLHKFLPRALRECTFRLLSLGRVNINTASDCLLEKFLGLPKLQA